jgi:hypothetical protein
MALAFYRILLTYDDSAASRMALQYACALARPGADLVLANACHDNNFVASAARGQQRSGQDQAAHLAGLRPSSLTSSPSTCSLASCWARPFQSS